MSGIPSEIPEIGSTGQKLRQSPVFDPLRAGVSTEEYFVWSRIDGVTTLRDLLLMTGFAPELGVQIVRRLRALGAVLLPGESAAPVRRPPTDTAKGVGPAPVPPRRPDSVVTPLAPAVRPPTEAPAVDVDLVDPDADELAALSEPVELDDSLRRRILAMARRAAVSDPRALLGVGPDADKQAIKRAYFRLSKDFHPDRFYRRRLGSFGARLATVFEALSHAYEELTTSGGRRRVASPSQEPQTPQEYAADLFARACATEVQGDPAGALKLFDAAIRVDGKARYLRRAASCALTARDVRLALEFAKKAANLDPGDPSTARLLAQAFRVSGKLADAEEVLVMAMALKNENDVLGAELRTDLSEVRRLLAVRGSDRSAER
jgi:hypothetical protein